MPLSGSSKVYAYADQNLSKKESGYYIDTFKDQVVVTNISSNGAAVYVTYPSSSTSTGYRSKWFRTDDIFGIENISVSSYTASAKSDTFRMCSASKVTDYGNIASKDACVKLGNHKVGNKTYAVTVYPISTVKINKVNGIKNKLAMTVETNSSSESKTLSDIARGEIGYQGTQSNGKGTGDYTKYGKWIGYDGVQWCASFVSWCANKAGISTQVIPKTIDCDEMESKSNMCYTWDKNTLSSLKKNDVIFFAKSNNRSDAVHVGIITGVNVTNKTISVIEGNTGQYYGPDIVKEITYTVDSVNGNITKGYNGYCFCSYISVK